MSQNPASQNTTGFNNNQGSSGGRYIPPNSRSNYRRSNFNRPSSSQKPFSSISSSAIPIDKEAAQRRKERFSNDQKKNREGYGLISRGEDNRLQRDPQARNYFFKQIQQEFTSAFAKTDVETVRSLFSNMSLENREHKEVVDKALMSLRKLREALLKFQPDEFAKSVFLYSIRLSSKIGHYQSYVPSINFLLKHQNILTSSELNEIANILALHLAHFNESNDGALEVHYKYAKDDLKLGKILKAWRSMDYVTWFKFLSNEKDLMYYKMMKYGEPKMVKHSLKCIQNSYFQLPKSYIDEIFHISFEDLQSRYSCKWALQDSTVIVRSRTK